MSKKNIVHRIFDLPEMIIYLTPTRDRFFLTDAELPPGDFLVRTVDRREMRVSEEALREFEIPKEQAYKLLEEQMRRSLRQVRDAIANSPDDESAAKPAPKAEELLRDVMQWPRGEELNEQHITHGLQALLTLLSKNLSVVASADPAVQAQAEESLTELRAKLEGYGFPVDQPIEELPAKLAAWREANPSAQEQEQVLVLLGRLKELNEQSDREP